MAEPSLRNCIKPPGGGDWGQAGQVMVPQALEAEDRIHPRTKRTCRHRAVESSLNSLRPKPSGSGGLCGASFELGEERDRQRDEQERAHGDNRE